MEICLVSARSFPMHEHIYGMVERAGSNEFARIYKKYFVGILDGIQPMGNNNAGSGGR
jgi:hypothetical protein